MRLILYILQWSDLSCLSLLLCNLTYQSPTTPPASALT